MLLVNELLGTYSASQTLLSPKEAYQVGLTQRYRLMKKRERQQATTENQALEGPGCV